MCNRSVREIRFLLMNSPVFAQEGLRGRGIEVRGVWGMRELFAGIWGKVCKGFDLFCIFGAANRDRYGREHR